MSANRLTAPDRILRWLFVQDEHALEVPTGAGGAARVLAEALGIPLGTMQTTLGVLARNGLVRRTQERETSIYYRIELTEAGVREALSIGGEHDDGGKLQRVRDRGRLGEDGAGEERPGRRGGGSGRQRRPEAEPVGPALRGVPRPQRPEDGAGLDDVAAQGSLRDLPEGGGVPPVEELPGLRSRYVEALVKRLEAFSGETDVETFLELADRIERLLGFTP